MDSFHYGVLLLVLSQPHPTPAALATFSISNPPTCVEYVCCAIAGICGSHARGVANFGTEVHAACLSAMGQFPPVRIPVFIMGCCVALLRMMDQNNDCGTTTTNNNNNNDNNNKDNNSKSVGNTTSTDTRGKIRTILLPEDNVFIPTGIYVVNCIVGTVLTGLNYIDAGEFIRAMSESLFPILFFDWILIMTRPRKAGEEFSIVEKFFRSDALQFMGRISMSFYMIHEIVQLYTALIVFRIRTNRSVTDEEEQSYLPSFCIPIVLVISLFLGWVLTEYFEAPTSRYIIKHYTTSTSKS
mmetsp:Transcript_11891/g.19601  ORF Transcript_11891/g.19601 Transcript_11891/m.19601 type:complete len:298 (-) Transcript_11891:304-1197(-)